MHAAAPYCSPRVAARSGATSRAASPASQPRRLRLPPPRAVLDVTEADFDAQVLQARGGVRLRCVHTLSARLSVARSRVG